MSFLRYFKFVNMSILGKTNFFSFRNFHHFVKYLKYFHSKVKKNWNSLFAIISIFVDVIYNISETPWNNLLRSAVSNSVRIDFWYQISIMKYSYSYGNQSRYLSPFEKKLFSLLLFPISFLSQSYNWCISKYLFIFS